MLSNEAQDLSEILITNGLTISVAESCTGSSLSNPLLVYLVPLRILIVVI